MKQNALETSEDWIHRLDQIEAEWIRAIVYAIGAFLLTFIPCIFTPLLLIFTLLSGLLLIVRYYNLTRARRKAAAPAPATFERDIGSVLAIGAYSTMTAYGVPWFLDGFLQIDIGFIPILPWLGAGPLLLALFLMLIITADFSAISSGNRVVRLICVFLCLIFITGGIGLYYHIDPAHQARKMFLRGSAKAILPNYDPVKLRAWLASVKYDSQEGTIIHDTEWPEVVKQLSPSLVYIDRAGILQISFSGFFLETYLVLLPGRATILLPKEAIKIEGGYLAVRYNSK